MHAIVIINEQHTLTTEQEMLLNERFDNPDSWEKLLVPADGWSLDEMREVARTIRSSGATPVFVSPVPTLLAMVAWQAGYDTAEGAGGVSDVRVFHNDNREKKELPDGRIIQTVSRTGWRLISVL